MPVYLCQSGSGKAEPWRYGIQVYSAPFPIEEDLGDRKSNATIDRTGSVSSILSTDAHDAGPSGGAAVTTTQSTNAGATTTALTGGSGHHHHNQHQHAHIGGGGISGTTGGRDLVVATWVPEESAKHQELQRRYTQAGAGHPIRRIRHAEIVLVDDVCIAYDRYWLRLRWPGHKGGFAGYIAMGLVSEMAKEDALAFMESTNADPSSSAIIQLDSNMDEHGNNTDDAELDDPAREEERQETGSMPPSEPCDESTSNMTLTCLRTGLSFQSSPAMRLMALYEDGVVPPVVVTPFSQEPVFCRICRESLHEDADQEQPSPAAEDGDDEAGGGASRETSSNNLGRDDDDDDGDELRSSHPPSNAEAKEKEKKGPIQPHPTYSANTDALQNPLLAPCECSGSMAFVHYLCVEQWRCRSRHPDAQRGLNCETCGTAYTLPPPSERPAHVRHMEQEDWLDAMPPHVMQALRQPHFWWQIGAALVRRRWLRPLAPVIMSPIVALYCRARRLLKKRGVARRRWACSLCRRRARWKCVRCLRSYYCSRQCQNVSWHIVHKHVCYKPVRFWWSVVVYGSMLLAMFPGIFRDPLMYDLGFCMIPVTFVVMGVIGGGLALATKKIAGIDLRGRLLEFAVVLCTCYLSVVSWCVVKGFFGESAACLGAFGSYEVPLEDVSSWYMLNFLRKIVLYPAQKYYLFWDGIPAKSNQAWIKKALCTNSSPGACFEHLPNVNPNFFTAENEGQRCAADMSAIAWLYVFALFTFVGSHFWKQHERQRRRQGRRPVRIPEGMQRPHQD